MFGNNYMNPYQQMYGGVQKDNVNWIQVNSLDEVKNIQVMAGQTAWLMDTNNPVFYVKEADNMGICRTKAYKFEEIDIEPKPQETNYVTKDELAELKKYIQELAGGKKDESIDGKKGK